MNKSSSARSLQPNAVTRRWRNRSLISCAMVLLFRSPQNFPCCRTGCPPTFHFEIPADHSAGYGKGTRRHDVYIYNRLQALNEVGGEPQQFGLGVDVFHERNLDRQRDWPATLLATSTHDTKRSEDVRARIVVISEIPELWRRSLQRWGTANHRWKRIVNDLEAPDANEEYLLYQTLLVPGQCRRMASRSLCQPLIISNGSRLT